MKELYKYFNAIAPLQENTWSKIEPLFSETILKKGVIFINEGEIAKQIGFLTSGYIRAFCRTSEGLEYIKHFFTQNNMVSGYSSLVSLMPSKIIQQAPKTIQFWQQIMPKSQNFMILIQIWKELPEN